MLVQSLKKNKKYACTKICLHSKVLLAFYIFQLIFVSGKYFSSQSVPEMPLIRGNLGDLI